jgi:hypothetical protein
LLVSKRLRRLRGSDGCGHVAYSGFVVAAAEDGED